MSEQEKVTKQKKPLLGFEHPFMADCPKCKTFGLDVIDWCSKGQDILVVKCPQCHAELIFDPTKFWKENGIYNVKEKEVQNKK